MRAVGLVCGLMRLKFVYLSERKGVCGANALNLGILAFAKALSAKSVANSACSVAWQGIANSVWQVFAGKTTHGKFGLASVAKWGSVWTGDLSLVARTFWHAFGLNLKGFFAHSRAKFNACFVI